MIARIWHGITEARQADEYLSFLIERAIPDYESIEGNRGAYILRRMDGEQAHFLTLSFWDSAEAIRKFAGADIEQARYYPEDANFLREFEPKVTHYQVYDKRQR